jgi:hypothetical protein
MEMIQIQNKSLARFSGSIIISFILKAMLSHNRTFHPLYGFARLISTVPSLKTFLESSILFIKDNHDSIIVSRG